MNRRRLLLIASLPLAIGATLWAMAILYAAPNGGITKPNFDRIEKGMTPGEVEAIFGCRGDGFGCFTGLGGSGRSYYIWKNEDGSSAQISFFCQIVGDDCIEKGVIERNWRDSTETVAEKLRRWLHLH